MDDTEKQTKKKKSFLSINNLKGHSKKVKNFVTLIENGGASQKSNAMALFGKAKTLKKVFKKKRKP